MSITYKDVINELFRDLQHLPTQIKTDIDDYGYDFCIAKQLYETNKLFKVKDSSPLIIVYKDENNTMTDIKTGQILDNIDIEVLGTDFYIEYFDKETYKSKETKLKKNKMKK